MRKKDLEKLILCLTEEERENVKVALETHKKGESLRQIFVAIIEAGQIDSGKLASKCKTSTRTIARTLNELENIIIGLIGSTPAELTMETQINAALELTLRMQFEPAIAIIRRVFTKARSTEEFNTIFVLYELSEMISIPFDLGHPTLDEVVALQHNLWSYEELKIRMKAVLKAEIPVDQFAERLNEIITHPLMEDETNAISIRAKAAFNWLLLRYYFHVGDMAKGLSIQERLVSILDRNQWLRIDQDFFLIKEYATLAGLYFKNDLESEGYKTIFNTGILPSDKALIEVSKLDQVYPLKTGLAIRKGDFDGALESINEVEIHLERFRGYFSPFFIYRNQYVNAYFYFSSKIFDKAGLILSKYFGKYKPEIPPLFWPIAKVMETYISYHQGEIDNTIRLIKNIRMTSHYDESPFFPVAVGLIFRLCNHPKAEHPQILRKAKEKVKTIFRDPTASYLFNFFDLSAWIEAELGRRKMIDVFGSRSVENDSDAPELAYGSI
ncbi:MAG: hypothetical protein AAF998_18370 [Bacteroidota bacterium]